MKRMRYRPKLLRVDDILAGKKIYAYGIAGFITR